MTLQLRLMALDDVPQVVDIEKRSFGTPWSPRTYAYEIAESRSSHMVVLSGPETANPQAFRLSRMLRALGYSTGESVVLAYGGLWNLGDEGHISTIASHPDHRRAGYGEAALAGMMMRAIVLDMSYVALEVRVSNTGAQALYRKYGFDVYGIKSKYYLDNGEDAYDMRVDLVPAARDRVKSLYDAVKSQLGFADTFTNARHNLD